MKLTHSQISEILSNYTSSSEGFVTLQSLIMNSLMYHETTHCENVGTGTNITYQKNCTDGKEDLPMSIGRRKLSVFLFTGFLIRIERNGKSDFPHYGAPVLLRRFPIGHSLHQTHGFGFEECFRID